MTLVIAGYEHTKSLNYSSWESEPDTSEPEMDVVGLFAVADSAITSHQGGRTLLNGFRKVHELEAKLWQPYSLPDGSFHSYSSIYERRSFFIGFSGSTLTAQHIINSITEHLGKLRISYTRDEQSQAIKYEVIRHCQRNPLSSNTGISSWDEDMFLDSDFDGLLTGKVIANIVEYSINDALGSASSYKLSMEEFQAMHTDLVCGVWCPYKKRHELYVYRMKSKEGEDGFLFGYTETQLLQEDQIAVLGMRKIFELRAKVRFDKSLSNYLEPANEMYKFLEECIDEIQDSGSKGIDRPTSFRRLIENRITREK